MKREGRGYSWFAWWIRERWMSKNLNWSILSWIDLEDKTLGVSLLPTPSSLTPPFLLSSIYNFCSSTNSLWKHYNRTCTQWRGDSTRGVGMWMKKKKKKKRSNQNCIRDMIQMTKREWNKYLKKEKKNEIFRALYIRDRIINNRLFDCKTRPFFFLFFSLSLSFLKRANVRGYLQMHRAMAATL